MKNVAGSGRVGSIFSGGQVGSIFSDGRYLELGPLWAEAHKTG